MSINLSKGQKIDLRKPMNESVSNDLSKLTIGLGWDVRKKGGLGGFFSGGADFDLDAVAILLEDNKLKSKEDIVYYGAKQHRSGNIWLTGDNLTGAGEGDDEQIIVNLDKIDPKYNRIVFFTSIYEGISRKQDFGQIENAYIRAVDKNNKEIAKYSISGDSSLSTKHSFVFADVKRENGSWVFETVGNSYDTDKLIEVSKNY